MAFEFKGSDTSQPVQIQSNQGALSIQFPAAMSGTSVELQGSFDGTNFYPIYQDGAKVTVAFVASSIHCLRVGSIFGIQHFRLKSTASETASIGFRCAVVV